MENFYIRDRRKPGLWTVGLLTVAFWLSFVVTLILILSLLTGCSTDGKFVRPIQTAPVVTPLPDGSTQTNDVSFVSPEWIAALETAQATGQLIPPPFGGWLSLGAAGIAALLAAIARNKQKNAEGIAESVIRGIEAAGATQAITGTTTIADVKAAIAEVASIKGNSAKLHNKVKELTK